MKIGFIGQGYIGKNYADDLEERGYDVLRYALDEPYIRNKDGLKDCDFVFIAVPTPTTPEGFDDSVVRSVLPLIPKGKVAVIKSTVLPGTTEKIQDDFEDIIVLHSPEFLSEASAANDARNPDRNIIGLPKDTPEHRKHAQKLLEILPDTPYELITTAKEAEMIKYLRNTYGYINIVYINLLHDFAQKLGVDWDTVQEAVDADPIISQWYCKPFHKSGRGAGGHCFIKDFEAFIQLHEQHGDDPQELAILKAMRDKNLKLLKDTDKDQDLVREIYGDKK